MNSKFPSWPVYTTEHCPLPLPTGHRFPIEKYSLIAKTLVDEKILSPHQLLPAPLSHQHDIQLAHDHEYVQKIFSLTLDPLQARKVGLPLTHEMVARARASVGAFCQATQQALRQGFSGALAGGTHHADFAEGRGFCWFNDFAVAAHVLWKTHPGLKILVLDLDVHQGDGTASLLGQHPLCYLVSFHGATNFPFKKIPGHLDVEFPAYTEDDYYLEKLDKTLGQLMHQDFDFIFYQAGVDALKEDSLGSLNLTHQGLIQRDELVFTFAQKKSIPLAMALGGGYSRPIEATVRAVVNTYRIAREFYPH